VTHPQLKHLPFILETPELETMIETNLKNVRALQNGLPLAIPSSEAQASSDAQLTLDTPPEADASPPQRKTRARKGVRRSNSCVVAHVAPDRSQQPLQQPFPRRNNVRRRTKRSTGREHQDALFV
jgi:hypothetical protein